MIVHHESIGYGSDTPGFLWCGCSRGLHPSWKPKPPEPLSPGIKISMQVDEHVTTDDLAWIKQMGIDYLNVQTGNGRATLENFLAIENASKRPA